MAFWVGDIHFDPATERKLRLTHNLTPAQVKYAVALGAHDEARWHDHPVYGRRLMLKGSDADSSLIAYLRPLDEGDGLWECLTAWRI